MRDFKTWLRKSDLFWEARTRIFIWYISFTALFVGLSVPIFTQLAIIQVDNRVKEDLVEEIAAFEESWENTPKKEITLVFDRFLKEKIPADKTFLIATVGGQFYRSSPISLPPAIGRNSSLIERLATSKKEIKGKNATQNKELGEIFYKTKQVTVDSEVKGVLIVAHISQGEREEVFAVIFVVIRVLLCAFVLASIFAWGISGNVLKPVRTLIDTANTIGETDLRQRIPLRGRGEMAELAETFNNMMNRLETAFNSQRQLLKDASHQLRTPITIIRGHLELLEYDDPQDRAETIDLVLDELDQMGQFIDDLILLAKAERKDFLNLETVNASELIAGIYYRVQSLGERKWHLANRDAKTTNIIKVDRQRIVQAMMHLAQNAVQHTSEPDTIALGCSVGEKEIRFWVKDTGTGIPQQDCDRIFERFFRSPNNSDRPGTGLGLSIVSAIAKSHNGHVELQSQIGKGSIFTIVLPKSK